jgi:hypothetical protein
MVEKQGAGAGGLHPSIGSSVVLLQWNCGLTSAIFQPEHPDFMDAYRISDGYPVMMKIINTTDHPHEVHMSLHASSDYKIACDPRNKAVPVHTLIPSPWAGCLILVMPLLRRFDDPGFDTMGEAVGFFKQMFEVYSLTVHHLSFTNMQQGLHLSHKNNVVHR